MQYENVRWSYLLIAVFRQQFVMKIDCSIFLYQKKSFGASQGLALTRKSFRIDPSHDTAIKGSKRGQEGITNEAIFQFRYFFA